MKQQGVMTIHDAVKRINDNALLVPGIQRNFVWKPKQIIRLFDSVTRGYPFGSMIFWKVNPGAVTHLAFEYLVTDYAGRGSTGGTANAQGAGQTLTILDGQQRLTALNIGLRGSYATAPVNRKARRLHIDLLQKDEDAGSERNMYAFSFLTAEEAADSGPQWIPLWDVFGRLKSADRIDNYLRKRDLPRRGLPRQTLAALVRGVHESATVPYQLESKNDLDRVLDVFARINNGGTKLTYAELLVSTATRTWKELNARSEIADLRKRLNGIGDGFNLGPERIMKTALVLVNEKHPKFSVEGFTRVNVLRIEQEWPRIRTALETAVRVLAGFGLSDRTLTAENVLIPIANYAYVWNLKPTFATAAARAKDRARIHSFVARTLLKQGFWTGAVDPILVACRRAIQKARDADKRTFPLELIERELARTADRSLLFSDEELEGLLETAYRDRRCLLLLRLMYPDARGSLGDRLDKDHVFPSSYFDDGHFRRHGVGLAELEKWKRLAELLPNLQLLATIDNQHKSTQLPADWLRSLTPSVRRRYRQQDLQHIPRALAEFDDFWEGRREAQRQRLRHLLGVI